jgi:hypothetical protein
MVYDNEEVGEEDLEEFEVRDAIESYIRDAWADLGGMEEERKEVQIISSLSISLSWLSLCSRSIFNTPHILHHTVSPGLLLPYYCTD